MMNRMNNILRRRNKRNAFTLIELLVVVLILGILLAVAIPLYLSSVRDAGDKTVRANLKTLGIAAQAYATKNGTYPTTAQLTGAGDVNTITGPKTTTYAVTTNTASSCVITASEGAQDSFGTSAASETITFQVETNVYTP